MQELQREDLVVGRQKMDRATKKLEQQFGMYQGKMAVETEQVEVVSTDEVTLLSCHK